MIILDIETTGLDPKTDFILEIAAVDTLNHRVFNKRAYAPHNNAVHVNRIEEEDMGRLTEDELLERFNKWLGLECTIGGWNTKFDAEFLYKRSVMRVIRNNYKNYKYTDVKKELLKTPIVGNLAKCYETIFNIRVRANHSAIVDTELTCHIYDWYRKTHAPMERYTFDNLKNHYR